MQNVQWVLSAYLLTYGGFMLLGGRAADLLGRRRMLIFGTVIFAVASLGAGLAGSQTAGVSARLAQGFGAAMMLPAALSLVTTTFNEGSDRTNARCLGAIAGVVSAAGVLLGGVLTQGPGWRWVFFVNPLICLGVVLGTLLLIESDRRSARLTHFDVVGAVLSTAGMLLLVYAIVGRQSLDGVHRQPLRSSPEPSSCWHSSSSTRSVPSIPPPALDLQDQGPGGG